MVNPPDNIRSLATLRQNDSTDADIDEEVLRLLRNVGERVAALPPADPKEAHLKVYWEFQGNDRLCAIHCLNSLLQGPVFNIADLESISVALDQEERKLLTETAGAVAGDAESAALLAGGSHNAADDGFFSFAVLETALKSRGFTLRSMTSSGMRYVIANAIVEDGFLCNKKEHWFVLRKVHGNWYNLDSLQPAPVPLQAAKVTEALYKIVEEGYAAFVVTSPRGLPDPVPLERQHLNPNQVYLTPTQIIKLRQSLDDLNKKVLAKYSQEHAADHIHASKTMEKGQGEFAWPETGGATIRDTVKFSPTSLSEIENLADDPELREALLLSQQLYRDSLPEPPPESAADEEGLMIQVRFSDGVVSRKFPATARVESVCHWLEKSRADNPIRADTNYSLVSRFPRRLLCREGRSHVKLISETNSIEDITQKTFRDMFSSLEPQNYMFQIE